MEMNRAEAKRPLQVFSSPHQCDEVPAISGWIATVATH